MTFQVNSLAEQSQFLYTAEGLRENEMSPLKGKQRAGCNSAGIPADEANMIGLASETKHTKLGYPVTRENGNGGLFLRTCSVDRPMMRRSRMLC